MLTTPHVRFVSVSSSEEKNQRICLEAEEMTGSGHRVLIWVGDREQAHRLDVALWSGSSTQFLPHAIWPCLLRVHPIIISWQPLLLPHTSHLIVAYPHPTHDPALQTWMIQFSSVLEFADTSESSLQQQSRERFRFWKQQPCPLHFEQANTTPVSASAVESV